MSRFRGPTSPNYNLNAANMKMCHESWSNTNSNNSRVSNIDEYQSDDGGSPRSLDVGSSSLRHHPADQTSRQWLLQFSNLFSLSRAIRLLYVYKEVAGDLHLIVDVELLVKLAEVCYTWSSLSRSSRRNEFSTDEDNFLILNLVIAIAVCSYPTSQFNAGEIIFNACKEIVGSRLTSPAASVEGVKITVLMV